MVPGSRGPVLRGAIPQALTIVRETGTYLHGPGQADRQDVRRDHVRDGLLRALSVFANDGPAAVMLPSFAEDLATYVIRTLR